MSSKSDSRVRNRTIRILTMLVLLATTHCSSTIGPSGRKLPHGWTEKIVSSEIEDDDPTGEHAVSVERDGDVLTVVAHPKCRATRVVSFERKGYADPDQSKRVLSGLLIGAGVAAIAGGVALGVHASNLGDTVNWDGKEPEDQEGQTAVLLTALGAAGLGGIGVIGLVQGPILFFGPRPTTVTNQQRTELPEPRECQTAHGQSSTLVELEPEHRASPRSIELGRTDKEGKLTVDLQSTLPAAWAKADQPSRVATLIVGGKKAGTVKIASLLAGQQKRLAKKESQRADQHAQDDEAAWQSSKVATCRRPKHSGDCSGVRRYLRRFPKGRHIDQARRVLKRVKAKLARLKRSENARAAREEQDEQRREKERERRETALAKTACLGECRSSYSRCNRSCSGLSTIASCRRQCRYQFTNCESECARESRGD